MINTNLITLVMTCGACPEQYDAYFNEELVGFVIFEVIGNYSILHFEKCDTRITGLGYFIKYQTINILKDLGVKTLNYEQDLGILGLRQAKISMNPDTYLKKFSIFI